MTAATLDAPRARRNTLANMAVGVADLTDFIRLQRFIDRPHLEVVLASFDEVCDEVLGDAVAVQRVEGGVFFAFESLDGAMDAACRLVRQARLRPELPPINVAVAAGPASPTILESVAQRR